MVDFNTVLSRLSGPVQMRLFKLLTNHPWLSQLFRVRRTARVRARVNPAEHLESRVLLSADAFQALVVAAPAIDAAFVCESQIELSDLSTNCSTEASVIFPVDALQSAPPIEFLSAEPPSIQNTAPAHDLVFAQLANSDYDMRGWVNQLGVQEVARPVALGVTANLMAENLDNDLDEASAKPESDGLLRFSELDKLLQKSRPARSDDIASAAPTDVAPPPQPQDESMIPSEAELIDEALQKMSNSQLADELFEDN